ncbi:NAD(P)H-dependent glycerol-3-phosphate dehydrogenase [Amylibacter sp. IMCC11727]|uniref:NAD(P)H-dependent glycerol-3-phosphate dehydrogenase n=1 Tax=Amylibacter sp. IMCC11727 TaxID=3039851 RepID=UPI00244E2675|nr:NAD(P)H-dependent glycerol-3-phosphate dehydrogenase [Amylibacter sp. IMCC11727]WGI21982.1 NAD(P)-dependent glycerol-3-phosphate dehydrogenase [Amylibacter sp. IMCC11727]
MTHVGVIGAGAFGTALASVMRLGGADVTLWGRDAAQVSAMQSDRQNVRYLPGVPLPDGLHVTTDLAAVSRADVVLMVLPAQRLRGFLNDSGFSTKAPVVLCAKGIEGETGLLQTQVLDGAQTAVLSGPGFATEMTKGMPTALSIACADAALGSRLQETLSTQSLRLYLTPDVTGVQLGGALKNVYAIACGIVVGAGLGESARAALMTRGFAELARLAGTLGAQTETLMGLSGFGDLALSCTSLQSRNFAFGEQLGRAGTFGTGKTVEGVATAEAVLSLATTAGVEMPIAQAVADVLNERQQITEALATLMSRPLKREG